MGEAEEEVTPFLQNENRTNRTPSPDLQCSTENPPFQRPSLPLTPRNDSQPLGCMAALTPTANAFSYFSTAMQSDGMSPPSTIMYSREREREKKNRATLTRSCERVHLRSS